ncbi:hypothetical protein ANO11243_033050 [Dothideomycetidae sp. 11243]|nr:hypothetical protein ANO11243_033050 [fungal sp. No.11243]
MAASQKKTVLITGCTPGGIGHSLALTLSRPPYSYHVFATARTSSSLSALADKPNITPLEADVTDSASIASLKDTVSAATGGQLDYLINNAGRNYTVPAAEVDMDEVRLTYATNVFGVIELCTAFTPLLVARSRQTAGQQIGSLAGLMPYAFGAVYNSTKAALHSYSDTLRLELEPLGVDVVTVVTGGVKSNIARTKRVLDPKSFYAPVEQDYVRRQTHSQQVGMPNEVYARRVAKQITAWTRKSIFWEGGKVWLAWFSITWLPKWVMNWYMRSQFGLAKLGRAGRKSM